MKRILALCFLMLAISVRPSGGQSQEPEQGAAQGPAQGAPQEPEANPGRPTVSTPATLTPVGYLQFETGFEPAFDSPEFTSRYGFSETIKLSVSRRLQLLVLSEPVARFTAEGTTANRAADVFVGAQGVLYQGEGAKPTLAAS